MSKQFERITPQVLDVLAALLAQPDHEAHGWPLATASGVCRASVYRILSRCEDAGIATIRLDETDPVRPARRLFKLSPDGARWARDLLKSRGR